MLSSSNFQTASKSLLIPTESSTVCLTMNGQSGVTSQGGAIADVVNYDEESLMPACPTTVQQQKQPLPNPAGTRCKWISLFYQHKDMQILKSHKMYST
ncbi:hypothetical protein Tco_0763584 [Tanacetum coccineum]